MNFARLRIGTELEKILTNSGITSPTPIQEKSIPEIAAGRDVITRAKTGTGKTLAFLLPILQKVKPELNQVQALIVSPTRELAIQITMELTKLLSAFEGMYAAAVYGGQDIERQMKKLKDPPSIIVATPGRLRDHVRRETINLGNVSTLVLDEADQMLHIGFLPEVEEIIDLVPSDRQILLFSATMPDQVHSIARRFMHKPVTISVKSDRITVEKIRQLVIETTDRGKQAALFKVINEEQPFMAIIFCRTKRRVNKLNDALKNAGYNSEELHGDLSQSKRERVMKRFREAAIHLLVATDVAARGLDVEGVTHVFNYDVPEDAESYIHRIGRTGRAGEEGIAITFIAAKDRQQLASIEKGIQATIERKQVEGVKIPSDSRVSRMQKGQSNATEKEKTFKQTKDNNQNSRKERGGSPSKIKGEGRRKGKLSDSHRSENRKRHTKDSRGRRK
ncbi:DEAD/DEAH box helicase [Peribacillus cavernae]|uniref:DEAD/DEAH box helicase n=1 Tax=Peribacillus cavernae TaxID=1674310 RepID=A0A433HTE8_9BACI|nr:DEAD/DEAH box helicase [Peribacillus cavernae]MDQ0218616.1 ATP-dependent RNA helicase DeaD [Peribacillus cavernae]RUQ31600.1 DEAD/DEAH box helicase [Peribacillus cavernae]